MGKKIGVISTKKLAVNQKQFLLNAGFKVMDEDFISINPIPFEINDIYDILIFTSQNTVQNILKYKDRLILKPVICVGVKTKLMLENHGFTVLNAQPEANELIKIIENEYLDKSFNFFCGTSRLDTIPNFLNEKGLKYEIIEVYETTETPFTIQSKMDSILFFSPSGVSSYVKKNSITDEICFCIGNTTAKTVEKYSKNIVIANQPTVENVIIQCINYYKANG